MCSLAVSAEPLRARLRVAGTIVRACLERKDFSEREDRDLYDEITLGAMEFELSDQHSSTSAEESDNDEALEELAHQIVNLRDSVNGRAIGATGPSEG